MLALRVHCSDTDTKPCCLPLLDTTGACTRSRPSSRAWGENRNHKALLGAINQLMKCSCGPALGHHGDSKTVMARLAGMEGAG